MSPSSPAYRQPNQEKGDLPSLGPALPPLLLPALVDGGEARSKFLVPDLFLRAGRGTWVDSGSVTPTAVAEVLQFISAKIRGIDGKNGWRRHEVVAVRGPIYLLWEAPVEYI